MDPRLRKGKREIPELPGYVINQTEWEKELKQRGVPGHRYADILLEEIKLLEEDDKLVHEKLQEIELDDELTHEQLEKMEMDDEEAHDRLKELEADDALVHEELREIEADDKHVHELLKREESIIEEVHDEALEEGFLNGLATPFAVIGFFTIVYLVYRIYKKIHEVAHEMLFVEGGYTKLPKSIDDDDADLAVPGTTAIFETELTDVSPHDTNESEEFNGFGDSPAHPV